MSCTAPDKDTVYSIIKALGRGIWSSSSTPAGLLVTLSNDGDGTADVAGALNASGYMVTPLQGRSLLVGGVDPLALLDAQIATLTAQREALACATWRCGACVTYNSVARQVCDVCGYTREGRDTRTNAA